MPKAFVVSLTGTKLLAGGCHRSGFAVGRGYWAVSCMVCLLYTRESAVVFTPKGKQDLDLSSVLSPECCLVT